MRTCLLATSILATACSIATADIRPPTPPGPPVGAPAARCKAGGDVLFQIADKVDPAFGTGGFSTWTTVLYDTGAWTYAANRADGTPSRAASGCLDAAPLKTIRADLARAKWIVKQADVACAAISANYVEYASHGKIVWTQRMCQLDFLDAASTKAIDEISKILAEASKPGSIEQSRGKP